MSMKHYSNTDNPVDFPVPNGRIKQLLGQAYDEAVPETWTTLSSEQLGRVYDKFAELIVQECVDIANDTRYDGKVVANRIKFVFGIDQ